VSPLSAAAQISPGELHQSHAFLEGVENCEKCHGKDRSTLGENCLVCHTPIQKQRQSGQGLHGGVDYNECQMCHVEHHGRDFELIYFKDGQKAFDHGRTDFALEGKHRAVDCRKCHNSGNIKNSAGLKEANINLERTFLGLDSKCSSCHIDQHRGQFASDCNSCHSVQGWKPAAGFDHNRAKYRLTGEHLKVDCTKCHPFVAVNESNDSTYQKFTNLSFANCSDCHKDPHQSRLGPNCNSCHTTTGWQAVAKTNFDHNKTRYPLVGQHAAVACDKCHTTRSDKALKFAACRDCHSDFHKAAFANRESKGACEECHTVNGFSPSTFTVAAHNKSDYPLEGAHLAIPCLACHKRETDNKAQFVFTFQSAQCQQCHSDPHDGSLSKFMVDNNCTGCHSVLSWAAVTYDHDKTEFPLRGIHAKTECAKCHMPSEDNRSILFTGLKNNCSSCHRDVHYSQFASDSAAETDCAICHTPDNWIATKFDHQTMASFKLDGSHIRVPCDKCHLRASIEQTTFVRYKPVSDRCVDCHGTNQSEGSSEL
jgi:hypothetical protein